MQTVNFQSTEHPLPKDAQVIFKPAPGPQTWALIAPEDEILIGGVKSGGKSFIGRAFILKGNPDADPKKHPANVSYVLHPNYQAQVLRRNFKDLTDWLKDARSFYEDSRWPLEMRAKYRVDDQYFEWPSGARCYVDH